MSAEVKLKSRKPSAAALSYNELRSALIARGMYLTTWAKARGYPYTTVVCAAKGERHGIKAVKIRRELEETVHA
jgi:hypothetical protein